MQDKIKIKFLYPNDVTVISSNVTNEKEIKKLISIIYDGVENGFSVMIDTDGGEGDKALFNLSSVEVVTIMIKKPGNNKSKLNFPRLAILMNSGRKMLVHVDMSNEEIDKILDKLRTKGIVKLNDYLGNTVIINYKNINSILTTNTQVSPKSSQSHNQPNNVKSVTSQSTPEASTTGDV